VVGLGSTIITLVTLWAVPLPGATTPTPASKYRIDRWTTTVVGLVVGTALAIGVTFGPAFGLGGGVLGRAWGRVHALDCSHRSP
jgi:hypothetical protein